MNKSNYKVPSHALTRSARPIADYLINIDERLNNLEKKVFKSKRKVATLPQQMLILHHLGLLDLIKKLDTTTDNKAKILSTLLNGDYDNIFGFLSNIDNAKNELNYNFLIEIFDEVKLKKNHKVVETELNKIINIKDKK